MNTEPAFRPPEEVDHRPVGCAACGAALRSPGRDSISFLVSERFTVPLVGCDDHAKRFGSLCDLAVDGDVSLLEHRPAGGITCPGCRRAPQQVRQPVVPVDDGRLAVLACPDHRSELVAQFNAGLRARHHLESSIDAF
jgi:hypothetical protein